MSSGKNMVLQTLTNATSQNPAILKPAELQLKAWETHPGFHSTLVEVLSDYSLHEHVRWMAVLYIKNGVDRYWRKSAPSALSESEKSQIRLGLMQSFNEPTPQIAVQMSVLIARLARIDFPKGWPDLLPIIYERTKSDNDLVHMRALLTLHHVVKQLASKRLVADRRVFQEIAPNMFGYLLELWISQTNAFVSQDKSSLEFGQHFERARLSLKTLRRLCVHGFKNPKQQPQIPLFINEIFTKMKPLTELYAQFEPLTAGQEALGKFIVLFTKVLLDLLESHPFAFLPYIKSSLELCFYYVFTQEGEAFKFPRLVLQCFNLMKAIMVCPEYRPSKIEKEVKAEETAEAQGLKAQFLTEKVVVHMSNKLMSQYFLLDKESLSLWDCSPEEFFLEDGESEGGGEAWKYCIKPCVETFFIALLHEYRGFVIPTILSMVAASNTPVQPHDFTGLVRKDAVYYTVGLAAFDLFDEIDFDSWFTNTLVHEIKVRDSNYRILRRRVIWLTSRWSSVKFSPANRPLLYEAIIHLLSPDEDFVVRMTAAMALRRTVDDFEFTSEQFSPFLPSSFSLLFGLLNNAHDCETKMQVLQVMSMIIDVVGPSIQSHTGPLVKYLPDLWQHSQDHDMLRCAILTVLVYLVNALMAESEVLHGFLISVIRFSTDVNETSHVYLIEDGLCLWNALIENCKSPSPAILDMFESLLPLLEDSNDHLEVALQITANCIVLDPNPFLSRYGERLVRMSVPLLNNLRSEGLVAVYKILEMMLRVSPTEAPALLQPILPAIFKMYLKDECVPSELSMYLSFASRLVLFADSIFSCTIKKVADDMKQSPDAILECVIEMWARKLILVNPEATRKLGALGLAQLCANNWAPILTHWSNAVTSVCEIVYDMSLDDSIEDKFLNLKEDVVGSMDGVTEHEKRLDAIARADIVHTTSLRHFLAHKLKAFAHHVQPDVLTHLVDNVGVDCKQLLHNITSS